MNTSPKPIEKGCLAMITYAPNFPHWVGCIVQVHECVGKVDTTYPNSIYWRIDNPDSERRATVCAEEDLLRIDDPDIQKQIESEQEKQILAGMPWTEVSNEKA